MSVGAKRDGKTGLYLVLGGGGGACASGCPATVDLVITSVCVVRRGGQRCCLSLARALRRAKQTKKLSLGPSVCLSLSLLYNTIPICVSCLPPHAHLLLVVERFPVPQQRVVLFQSHRCNVPGPFMLRGLHLLQKRRHGGRVLGVLLQHAFRPLDLFRQQAQNSDGICFPTKARTTGKRIAISRQTEKDETRQRREREGERGVGESVSANRPRLAKAPQETKNMLELEVRKPGLQRAQRQGCDPQAHTPTHAALKQAWFLHTYIRVLGNELAYLQHEQQLGERL